MGAARDQRPDRGQRLRESNVLEAFAFLRAIRDGRLRHYVAQAGGADRILHFGARHTNCLVLDISFDGGKDQYRIELSATDDDTLVPTGETASFWDRSKHDRPYDEFLESSRSEAGISNPQPASMAGYVRKALARWTRYHFHDTSVLSPMRKTCDVHDNRILRSDGANLAAFLYRLGQTHPSRRDLIRRTVQLAAPFFRDFQLAPMALNEEKIRLDWSHVASEGYFGPAALSDGTLRFIALATVLLQPEELRPSVTLLDEPEIGLHPVAICHLASLVRQASVRSQVILATQSPILLDYFRPEDTVVVERTWGETTLTRKSSDELRPWLEEFSLGQLWEKNHIGGRPSGERRPE